MNIAKHPHPVKIILPLLAAAAVFFVLNSRKETVAAGLSRSLVSYLTQGSDYEVKIGKVTGNCLGFIGFQNVQVLRNGGGGEGEVFFGAKAIEFRYRFWDFLLKELGPVHIVVKSPELYWNPRIGLRKPSLPFLGWMRQWALSRASRLQIQVEGMVVFFNDRRFRVTGIDAFFGRNSFWAEIPLRHIDWGGADLSSIIKVKGHFDLGGELAGDTLIGEMGTEGTVINWRPVPEEAALDFILTKEKFSVHSSRVWGGMELEGAVDFTNDYASDFNLKTEDYPLRELASLFSGVSQSRGMPQRVDFQIHAYGNPWLCNVEGSARVENGFIGERSFKVMDLAFQGVYPTLHLSNSTIRLEDDTVMHLANKALEVKDFFKEKTYHALVGEAPQETVVWGDWELQNTGEAQVGFGYRLRPKHTLRFGLRQDEEFIGVEKKLRF
ncbi:MAG: hypothetical protein HY593_04910 [Candidatus Omnitrophica bacterium]|nr:hypothetical protein [Candidatus Omnitrophota bacterium]